MHVAGLLARWPLQALGNAVRLLHHMWVYWILNHALHTAILHAAIASGGTRAIDTGFVDVRACLPRVRCYNSLSCRVYRTGVDIQAHEVLMDQWLERERQC